MDKMKKGFCGCHGKKEMAGRARHDGENRPPLPLLEKRRGALEIASFFAMTKKVAEMRVEPART
jgi:hypothetical protein